MPFWEVVVWFFTKTRFVATTETPSIVWAPERVMLAVVATRTAVRTVTPEAKESTYAFVAASVPAEGVGKPVTVAPFSVPPVTETALEFWTAMVPRVPAATVVSPGALVMPAGRAVPVRVPAAAATVMGVVPSKLTPLMARGVASRVAVVALPVMLPVMVFVTVSELRDWEGFTENSLEARMSPVPAV